MGELLTARAAAPFRWGRNDCALFCADVVKAITGEDPVPEFRGKYRSEPGAQRALKSLGKGTLTRTLDAKFDRVEPAFAQRGDLVMVKGMVGICIGAHAVFVGVEREGSNERDGLVRFGRSEWRRAWKVGR